MKRRTIYNALKNQPSWWIVASANKPNIYMKKSTILLHYLILRERGLA